MNIEAVRGTWLGTIAGTNTGRIRVTLTPVPTGVVADVMLVDDTSGTAQLIGTGSARNSRLHLTLVASNPAQAPQFGDVQIDAGLTDDGKLTGTWNTSVGTEGTFDAQPEPAAEPMAPSLARLSAAATEKRLRIPSCVVDTESLTRILAALRTGAEEAARLQHAKQIGPGQVSLDRLSELYRVTVILRGAEGELVLSADEHALTRDLLPRPLRSVEFEIGFAYRLSMNGQQPPNRATVTLDFARPSVFDLSDPSGSPTPNTSSIAVYGSEPIWVSGVYERVRAVLQQGAVRTGWIHSAHIYDFLAYVFGIPLALAAGVLAATWVPTPSAVAPVPFAVAVFVFAAITAMYLFRLAFSATRWLLPYVEFATAPEPLHRRLRVVFAAVIVGAIASLAAAAIWTLFQ